MRSSLSRKVFVVFNTCLLVGFALSCILPIVNLAAVSLSSAAKAEAGKVGFIPVDFTLASYQFIFKNNEFIQSFINSIVRLFLGVPLNMVMVFLAAYPLSRPKRYLKGRSFFSWFFVITMLFSGGLIPTYMLVNALHLNNTVWALILPGAVPIFNLVLMINFFKQVPEDFYEAAVLDGAGELRVLCQIYIPLALPSVITILLFTIVAHWNSWFDGIIYMNDTLKYPLQSYLQAVVISKMDVTMDIELSTNLNQQTMDAARLFLATLPILLIYLPLQKYFIKGLHIGGVKG